MGLGVREFRWCDDGVCEGPVQVMHGFREWASPGSVVENARVSLLCRHWDAY